ncbi:MAG: cytochrome c1 [Gammaproteobacteria bacterium]|nr:cytochrome c1 [Gammaproteobacteria bacterium]MCZ6856350.1 cytochrome c1 [Gammaproteobacteria bacterium]
MKIRVFVTMCLLVPGMATASSAGDWQMKEMSPDLENQPSLQRGFHLYVNYCLGCHSLKYQRYERTADDLGIAHDIALETLVFTGQKIGDLMTSAMDPEQAKSWFGAPPPDLTMVARVRDPTWIYNYLITFYVDETRPFGVNNKVFPNVGMPHVLMDLQGLQSCVPVGDGASEAEPCELVVLEGGLYDADEYDQAAYDIANFLFYTGDPSRLERHRLGVYVLLFLVILYVLTFLLGREYTKEVH